MGKKLYMYMDMSNVHCTKANIWYFTFLHRERPVVAM